MVAMTIQDIDEQLETRLRIQAAKHGRSMEEEARDILRTALSTEPVQGTSLVDSIRARIDPLGGVELELPRRDAIRNPTGFDE
ncbi:plasmid stability protein-like protein [Caballeronia temeraria]|uniref:Plasmid stability protein-like protein n=1 Tax=Caballeronia temeraria TaxID=1777137 RepID=A0A158BNQ7_9BURK|nr:plasmid stability protein [Caballeronia temeraria]SAK71719.1 plasmid stability protein-like protein [Caballeronia temeraria]